MKKYLLRIGTWLVLAMAAIVISPVGIAQDQSASGGNGEPGFHRGDLNFLTPEEKQEFLTARKAVMTANPDLKKQGEDLMEQGKALRQNSNATADDKKSYMEQLRNYQKTVHADMLQQDPNLQPILQKIAEHFKGQNGNNSDSNNEPSDTPSSDAPPTS